MKRILFFAFFIPTLVFAAYEDGDTDAVPAPATTMGVMAPPSNRACWEKAASTYVDYVTTGNTNFVADGKFFTLPENTQLTLENIEVKNGQKFLNITIHSDGPFPGNIQIPAVAFPCDKLMELPEGPDAVYSLPSDYEYASKHGGKVRKRGVTACYHRVKPMVWNMYHVHLTGSAAYMANQQLINDGFHNVGGPDTAPIGAICVYNKGGKRTASGGATYGHIEMRKACGWDYGYGCEKQPTGPRLQRPLMGCYTR